jgi:predicted O-methyltransferase YrrM
MNIYAKKGNPAPWIATDAIPFLNSIITKDSVVIEIGSGGSTIWFAKRARKVISYEDNIQYYNDITAMIHAEGLSNIEYIFTPNGKLDTLEPCDVLFVDNEKEMGDRVAIAYLLFPMLKTGGYLVMDDMERYNRYEKMKQVCGTPVKMFKGRDDMPNSKTETAFWHKR